VKAVFLPDDDGRPKVGKYTPSAKRKKRRTIEQSVLLIVLINDIVVVETSTARKGASAHRIQITTLSVGYFDIVLAFLQACVPMERILD
jgi:hypothetical protein